MSIQSIRLSEIVRPEYTLRFFSKNDKAIVKHYKGDVKQGKCIIDIPVESLTYQALKDQEPSKIEDLFERCLYEIQENRKTENTFPERLDQKITGMTLATAQNEPVNWEEARIVTPGGIIAYKTQQGISFGSVSGGDRIELFRGRNQLLPKIESHGLIFSSDQKAAAAASVTRGIVKEPCEKDKLFSYDKTKITPENFGGRRIRYKGDKTFYDAGHLIDAKYNAQESNYCEKNIIPQHYYYNFPLKEYLVQRCEQYCEIPVYTSNPPTIKPNIKKYEPHPIPIGILFVQIKNNTISDIYLFPNNDFDFKMLLDPQKKTASESILPYFKLKKEFHSFFQPAIITDLQNVVNGKKIQINNEKKFSELLREIHSGMSLQECSEDQNDIVKLSYDILNDQVHDTTLYYDGPQFSNAQKEKLKPVICIMGEFIIQYVINNALKSEFISIDSRATLLNILMDFVSEYPILEGPKKDFYKEFIKAFSELYKIKTSMNKKELICLANLYSRLTILWEYEQKVDYISDNFQESLEIITFIKEKHTTMLYLDDIDWIYLDIVLEVQNIWTESLKKHLQENQKELYHSVKDNLISLRPYCVDLLEKLLKLHPIKNQYYQSNNIYRMLKNSYSIEDFKRLGE